MYTSFIHVLYSSHPESISSLGSPKLSIDESAQYLDI